MADPSDLERIAFGQGGALLVLLGVVRHLIKREMMWKEMYQQVREKLDAVPDKITALNDADRAARERMADEIGVLARAVPRRRNSDRPGYYSQKGEGGGG